MRIRSMQMGLAAALGLALSLLGSGGRAAPNVTSEMSEMSETGAPSQQGVCGAPGLPPCPLQRWMRARVATPLAQDDLVVLAASLERTATLSPDASWSAWPDLARRGAAAAKRGDLNAARATCKACHDSFREAYRAKYRLRPVPR